MAGQETHPMDERHGHRVIADWHPPLEPGSPEWHRFRRDKIGGSDIVAIMGLSTFASYATTYWLKRGLMPPPPDDEEAEWGRRSEPMIRGKFVENHPELDHWLDTACGHFTRSDAPWQLASPDHLYGFARPAGLVEIKAPRFADGFGPAEIPDGYLAQTLWNAHVIGVDEAWLVAKIGQSDYREYHLGPLDAYAPYVEAMIDAGEEFMRRLAEHDDPTPGDGLDATYQGSRRMHPEINYGTAAEISAELAGEFMIAKDAFDQAKREWNRVRTLVNLEIAPAQYATLGGTRVAYRTTKSKADGTPGLPYVEADRTNFRRLSAGGAFTEGEA